MAAIAPDRRAFLTSSAATLAAAAGGSEPLNLPPGKPVKRRTRRANRIAVSTYSFWQFRRKDLRNIETCIDLAADMGFDGVEILHRQMEQEDNAYLQRVKRRAFLLGLDLCGFSTHQTFLSPDRQTRQKNIDHTWITTRLSKKASRAWTA